MSPASSAPDGGVGMWASIIGIGATVLGVFAGMVGIGRKIESIDGKVKSHEQALKDVFGLFKDSDGNPRFVTMIVCKEKSSQCGLLSGEKFSHVGERITALTLEIAGLRKEMKVTQDETLRAILAEMRKE